MNILLIGELYKYGGASEVMEMLGKSLGERGHKVFWIYGYNYHNKDIEYNHFVIFNNAILRKINTISKKYVEKNDLSNIYAMHFVKKFIKNEQIDVIHMHAMQNSFLSYRNIENICKHNNVIWTIHDTWPFTGGCMYYCECHNWYTQECKECKEEILQCEYQNTQYNYNRKKRMLKDNNIVFVTPSQWMYNNLEKSFLCEEERYVINNGVDLKLFRPLAHRDEIKSCYGIDKRKNVLMFLAGNTSNKYKGWKYLRDALKLIKQQEKYFLIVVGCKSNDLEEIAIDKMELGYVENKEELNRLYNCADLFIIPSEQDNFPTVTLEAMAAGTPVVAFDVGGLPEQITHEVGWIVQEKNEEGIAELVNSIFTDENKRNELKYKGINARKRCELLYDMNIMANKYEKLYEKGKI